MAIRGKLTSRVRCIDDLQAGTVLPFVIESNLGVPMKAPSPPRSRRVEVDPEIGSGSSATFSTRRLPALISLLYPALKTSPAPNFQLKLKDSVEMPIEHPFYEFVDAFLPKSMTCLCEVIDPAARPGSPGSRGTQAVIKFSSFEALEDEQDIYTELQEMQGTFMPIFLGRIRVPNTGLHAILLEYVDHVEISSKIKTPKQLTDLVEANFIFFVRLIELNILRLNWERLENIAMTAEGQLVFFGFGRCQKLHERDPGNDIFLCIAQLRYPLGFDDENLRTWQYMMEARAIVVYTGCLKDRLYPSKLTAKEMLHLEEKTLRYRILALTRNFTSPPHTLYDAICGSDRRK